MRKRGRVEGAHGTKAWIVLPGSRAPEESKFGGELELGGEQGKGRVDRDGHAASGYLPRPSGPGHKLAARRRHLADLASWLADHEAQRAEHLGLTDGDEVTVLVKARPR